MKLWDWYVWPTCAALQLAQPLPPGLVIFCQSLKVLLGLPRQPLQLRSGSETLRVLAPQATDLPGNSGDSVSGTSCSLHFH